MYLILATLQQQINDLPSISFEEYFTMYVLQMQDINIADEFHFLLRNNFLTTIDVDKLTFQELRVLNND